MLRILAVLIILYIIVVNHKILLEPTAIDEWTSAMLNTGLVSSKPPGPSSTPYFRSSLTSPHHLNIAEMSMCI